MASTHTLHHVWTIPFHKPSPCITSAFFQNPTWILHPSRTASNHSGISKHHSNHQNSAMAECPVTPKVLKSVPLFDKSPIQKLYRWKLLKSVSGRMSPKCPMLSFIDLLHQKKTAWLGHDFADPLRRWHGPCHHPSLDVHQPRRVKGWRFHDVMQVRRKRF